MSDFSKTLRGLVLAIATLACGACGESALPAGPRPLPAEPSAPSVAGAGGHEDAVLALERRQAAFEVKPATNLAEALVLAVERRELHEAWQDLLSRTRGTAFEGYCALRVEQYQQRRDQDAEAAFAELKERVAGFARDRRWDKCRAEYEAFTQTYGGTSVMAHLALERAQLESQVRDETGVSDWRIEFAEREGSSSLVGATFRRHDPALKILVADDIRHEDGRLKLVRSGASALEIGCAFDSVPTDAEWRMTLAATTSYHRSHSRATLTINGKTVFAGWLVDDDAPRTYFWPVRSYLVAGENRFRLSLDAEARTLLGVFDAGLIVRE